MAPDPATGGSRIGRISGALFLFTIVVAGTTTAVFFAIMGAGRSSRVFGDKAENAGLILIVAVIAGLVAGWKFTGGIVRDAFAGTVR